MVCELLVTKLWFLGIVWSLVSSGTWKKSVAFSPGFGVCRLSGILTQRGLTTVLSSFYLERNKRKCERWRSSMNSCNKMQKFLINVKGLQNVWDLLVLASVDLPAVKVTVVDGCGVDGLLYSNHVSVTAAVRMTRAAESSLRNSSSRTHRSRLIS